VGGDGTLNEIVNGLMTGSPTQAERPRLAVIPVGTGSDFARGLGLDGSPASSVQTLLNGQTNPVDIGRVDFRRQGRSWTRYFINVFDAGLGGQVVRIANAMPKHLGGFITFLASSLAGLATFRAPTLRVMIDGQPVASGPITIVGCANGQYFGGGMHIASMARLDDGHMEILYVRDTTLFTFLRRVLLPVYKAGHLGYERLFHQKGQSVAISGTRIFLCEVDGEEERAETAAVTLLPRALRIVMPVSLKTDGANRT
jgi:YegS/Rv2252/BmrU family lipid kinase